MPRILIIEDNAANLDLVVYLLTASGYDVVSSTNGSDGISRAITDSPDLILCDVNMGGVDGYAVVDALLKSPDFRQVPILAYTAMAQEKEKRLCLEAGFTACLCKPMKPQVLLKEISNYLGL
jgi:CheY-like chemotaxis protein